MRCHGIQVPIDDDLHPIRVIDLDEPQMKSFLDGTSQISLTRADCFIVYEKITAIMELKSSYPERAIPQLKRTYEKITSDWVQFVELCGLDTATPKPGYLYFCSENGLGGSRFERDTQGFLREKSRVGRNRGSVQKINNIPIRVYTKQLLRNSYNLQGVH